MGKIARTIAVVHEHTTDNLVDGTKFLGRKIGGTIVSGVRAVKAEHTVYENQRQVKRAAKIAQAEAMEEIVKEAEQAAAKKVAARKSKATPVTSEA